MAKIIEQLKALEAKANAELDNTEQQFTDLRRNITDLYERTNRLREQLERMGKQMEQMQAQMQVQDELEDRREEDRREEERDREWRRIHEELVNMTQCDVKFSTEISKQILETLAIHHRITYLESFQAVQMESYRAWKGRDEEIANQRSAFRAKARRQPNKAMKIETRRVDSPIRRFDDDDAWC